MSRRWAVTIILLGLAWYALLGLQRPDRPGLQYDECLFIPPLLNAPSHFAMARLGENGPVLMHMPYLGGLKSILMKPVFAVAGINVRSIRYPMVLLGLLALALTALWAWGGIGRREAALAVALLALDPSTLHHVREDWGPCALALLLRTGVLLALFRFIKNGKTGALFLAAFLAGLAVWNKADFALFLVALALAAGIWLRAFLAVNARTWVKAAIFFILGCLPALLFWLTQAQQLSLAAQATQHPFSLVGFGYKLLAVFDTLRGFYPIHTFLGEGSITTKRTLLPHVLLAGLLLLPWLNSRIRRGGRNTDKTLLFLATLFGAHFLLLVLTPQTFGSHHFFSLAPVAHLLAAALIVSFLDLAFTSELGRRAAAVLLLFPILLTGLIASVDAEVVLNDRGGDGAWSPSIYQLADELDEQSDSNVVFLDWGLANPLVALRGRFAYEEVFWSLAVAPALAGALDELDRRLLDSHSLFISHHEGYVVFDQVSLRLGERMTALNVEIAEEKIIAGTLGKPLYRIFRVQATKSE